MGRLQKLCKISSDWRNCTIATKTAILSRSLFHVLNWRIFVIKFVATLAAMLAFSLQIASAKCSGENVLDDILGDSRAEFEQEASDYPYGQGRYWEAMRDGKRTVLIGTFHVSDPRITAISPQMRQEIENASMLLVEIPHAEKAGMESELQNHMDLLFNLDGPRLKDQLAPNEWDELVERGRAAGIPPNMLNIMQPWFIGMSLAMPACALKEMQSGEPVLDGIIENIAHDAGVPVQGLDDMIDLFSMLSEGSFDEQMEGLRASLSMGATQDQFETSTQLYLEDRIAEILLIGKLELTRKLGEEKAEELLDDALDKLLVRRNTDWMRYVLPAAEAGDAVIAVGALHLGGDSGLLRMLESHGFSVKRLSLTP